jgi:hypothetical protein
LPYTCDDACAGQRCVVGTTISPACYTPAECAATCEGSCVDVQAMSCSGLCELADQVVAEQADPACDPAVDTAPRLAANQKGPCLGNMEICKSTTNTWRLADDAWVPEDETCNGVDDDCNGVADDMFETCGDPGLCQNTVNTCDPSNPTVPVPCVTLPPPSPFEICNDGLDNDCDGDADDGCECGDDECMPGEPGICLTDCPPANGDPCDDGNFCTLGDAYQNSVCLSGAITNTCADGNACTIDEACDPAIGCSATKLDCGDNDACTIDACDPDTGCVHTPNPDCQGEDADGDGFVSDATGGNDCDDGNPAVHPGATELCNGVDDDCEGGIDEGFDIGAPCQSDPNDCDAFNQGALECAADGLSVTCNAVTPPNPPGYGDSCTSAPNACGATAAGTIGCDGACSAVSPPAADADGDGTPDCLDQCPADPSKTTPGLCGCGLPETVSTFYRDLDADGFGDPAASVQACSAPAGFVANNIDCDDGNASRHPGAAEVCNGIDDDCDGAVEDGVDADHDGVNDCGADRCLGTRADGAYMPPVPALTLLPQHWKLRASGAGYSWQTTPQPKLGGFKPTIADTHGCGCKQILDALRGKTHQRGERLVLLGQYLFGCTRGTLERWIAM